MCDTVVAGNIRKCLLRSVSTDASWYRIMVALTRPTTCELRAGGPRTPYVALADVRKCRYTVGARPVTCRLCAARIYVNFVWATTQ